jgi:hypothetical protein
MNDEDDTSDGLEADGTLESDGLGDGAKEAKPWIDPEPIP